MPDFNERKLFNVDPNSFEYAMKIYRKKKKNLQLYLGLFYLQIYNRPYEICNFSRRM